MAEDRKRQTSLISSVSHLSHSLLHLMQDGRTHRWIVGVLGDKGKQGVKLDYAE